VGFVVDKVILGQVFSEHFCYSFHRLLDIHHHPSSGAGTVGQIVASVIVDSVPLHSPPIICGLVVSVPGY
jgi:hypothetical protein